MLRHAAERYGIALLLPPASRSGAIHVEDLSAHMTCLRQVKNGVDNIPYRRLFHSRLQRGVVGIIAVHWCIHNAGGDGIKADTIFCILDCKILGC